MFVPILVIAAGYTVASYGFLLVKGYDITLREWVSPLHPYRWPKTGAPPLIQPGRIFPGG